MRLVDVGGYIELDGLVAVGAREAGREAVRARVADGDADRGCGFVSFTVFFGQSRRREDRQAT